MPLALTNPTYTGQLVYWRADDSPFVTVSATELSGVDIGTFVVSDSTLHSAGLSAGEHTGKYRVGAFASPAGTDRTIGVEPKFQFDGTNIRVPLVIADVQTAMTNQGYTAARGAYQDILNAAGSLITTSNIAANVPTAGAIATAVGAPSAASIATAVATNAAIVTGLTGITTLQTRLSSTRANNLDNLAITGGLLTTSNIAAQSIGLTSDTLAAVRDSVLGGKMYITGSVTDTGPTTGSFKGNAGLSASNNFYSLGKSVMTFTSGPLQGMSNRITSYTGATRTFAFAVPWPSAPANGDNFVLMGRIE